MRQQVSILTYAGLSQRYVFIGKLGLERSQGALSSAAACLQHRIIGVWNCQAYYTTPHYPEARTSGSAQPSAASLWRSGAVCAAIVPLSTSRHLPIQQLAAATGQVTAAS